MKSNSKAIGLTMLLMLALSMPALGKDTIEPNKSKEFAGTLSQGRVLNVDLITEHTTQVQIIVKKQDEILESHSLITGPRGVIDGKFRRAVRWGYQLPPNTQADEYDVFIMVLGFGGAGSSVSYDIAPGTTDSVVGFGFGDA